MSQITTKMKGHKERSATGRLFVAPNGQFYGEYFLDENGDPLPGSLRPPSDAIEVKVRPPSASHIWNPATKQWREREKTQAEINRADARQQRLDAKERTIAKFEALGITREDLRALFTR